MEERRHLGFLAWIERRRSRSRARRAAAAAGAARGMSTMAGAAATHATASQAQRERTACGCAFRSHMNVQSTLEVPRPLDCSLISSVSRTHRDGESDVTSSLTSVWAGTTCHSFYYL
jgi:hypothetical protein